MITLIIRVALTATDAAQSEILTYVNVWEGKYKWLHVKDTVLKAIRKSRSGKHVHVVKNWGEKYDPMLNYLLLFLLRAASQSHRLTANSLLHSVSRLGKKPFPFRRAKRSRVSLTGIQVTFRNLFSAVPTDSSVLLTNSLPVSNAVYLPPS